MLKSCQRMQFLGLKKNVILHILLFNDSAFLQKVFGNVCHSTV